jgi:hypothetical protein
MWFILDAMKSSKTATSKNKERDDKIDKVQKREG